MNKTHKEWLIYDHIGTGAQGDRGHYGDYREKYIGTKEEAAAYCRQLRKNHYPKNHVWTTWEPEHYMFVPYDENWEPPKERWPVSVENKGIIDGFHTWESTYEDGKTMTLQLLPDSMRDDPKPFTKDSFRFDIIDLSK